MPEKVFWRSTKCNSIIAQWQKWLLYKAVATLSSNNLSIQHRLKSKISAKNKLWNWLVIPKIQSAVFLGHTYALTSFECEETFAITRLTNFAVILTKRHYLRCSGERTIDSIRGCYKNQIQADWPRLPAILILRLETLHLMLLKLFEQKYFLSNCRKQLVAPVNLTKKNFQFNLS